LAIKRRPRFARPPAAEFYFNAADGEPLLRDLRQEGAFLQPGDPTEAKEWTRRFGSCSITRDNCRAVPTARPLVQAHRDRHQ